MLTLIGLFIFASAEFLFDYSAEGESTNWYIFYFVSTYLSSMLISIDLLVRERWTSKSVSFTGLGFSLFFAILIAMELIHINAPFEEYIVSVNDSKIRILAYGLFSIILIFISLQAWERRLSKTY